MLVTSPGKLIISGEHAVVYGQPALVVAVNRFAHADINPRDDGAIILQLSTDQGEVSRRWEPAQLELKAKTIRSGYAAFCRGECAISRVLDDPLDLIPYALAATADRAGAELNEGCILHITSSIPVGCGMGSSAAVSLCTVRAGAVHFGTDLKEDEVFGLALECERLIHGTPSGIDPFICLHGGFIRFQQGNMLRRPPLTTSFHLALTGKPACSTGECVSHVREHFENSNIWESFGTICNDMETAMARDDAEMTTECVRRNQQLLADIGVVPPRVQAFIREIESRGGAAKISGAGAIRGEAAGAVIIFSAAAPVTLCNSYGYELYSVQEDRDGLRIG